MAVQKNETATLIFLHVRFLFFLKKRVSVKVFFFFATQLLSYLGRRRRRRRRTY